MPGGGPFVVIVGSAGAVVGVVCIVPPVGDGWVAPPIGVCWFIPPDGDGWVVTTVGDGSFVGRTLPTMINCERN